MHIPGSKIVKNEREYLSEIIRGIEFILPKENSLSKTQFQAFLEILLFKKQRIDGTGEDPVLVSDKELEDVRKILKKSQSNFRILKNALIEKTFLKLAPENKGVFISKWIIDRHAKMYFGIRVELRQDSEDENNFRRN